VLKRNTPPSSLGGMTPDRAIADLAAPQHGRVTRDQLLALGLTGPAIDGRVRRGALHVARVGVYAVGHAAPCDDAELLTAVMCGGPAASLGFPHAAERLGMLPPWELPGRDEVHIVVPPGCHRGRRAAIKVHRALLAPEDRIWIGGIPQTGPARTALDAAEVVERRALERMIDQAIVDGHLDEDGNALRAMLGRCAGRHGQAPVRALLADDDRLRLLSRSELEERMAVLFRGLGRPEYNVRLGRAEVDALFRAEKVVVEVDGTRFHRTRMRIENDRDRERRHRALGFWTIRYSARQLFDEPFLVVADLAQVLASRR
jgi:uncharacterized small protein (DUF1192 family)